MDGGGTFPESKMKERILYGWNFVRVLYTLIGVATLIDSVHTSHFLGVLIGGYFTAMGVFAFGCAGNSCAIPVSNTSKIDKGK